MSLSNMCVVLYLYANECKPAIEQKMDFHDTRHMAGPHTSHEIECNIVVSQKKTVYS